MKNIVELKNQIDDDGNVVVPQEKKSFSLWRIIFKIILLISVVTFLSLKISPKYNDIIYNVKQKTEIFWYDLCNVFNATFHKDLSQSTFTEIKQKNMPTKDEIDSIIEMESKKYGISPILAKAIISVESNGNPYAFRFEQSWKDYYSKNYPKTKQYSNDEEYNLIFSSFGLMQISYVIWNDFCNIKHHFELFDVKTNLSCGISILNDCIQNKKDIRQKSSKLYQCLVEYNCGANCSGNAKNRASSYADKIMTKVGEILIDDTKFISD